MTLPGFVEVTETGRSLGEIETWLVGRSFDQFLWCCFEELELARSDCFPVLGPDLAFIRFDNDGSDWDKAITVRLCMNDSEHPTVAEDDSDAAALMSREDWAE